MQVIESGGLWYFLHSCQGRFQPLIPHLGKPPNAPFREYCSRQWGGLSCIAVSPYS
jgi:hypothetical protein